MLFMADFGLFFRPFFVKPRLSPFTYLNALSFCSVTGKHIVLLLHFYILQSLKSIEAKSFKLAIMWKIIKVGNHTHTQDQFEIKR